MTHSRVKPYVYLLLVLGLLLMPVAVTASGGGGTKSPAEKRKAFMRLLNSSRPNGRANGFEVEDVDKMFGADKESEQRKLADQAVKDKLEHLARFDEQNAATIAYSRNGLQVENSGYQSLYRARLRQIGAQRTNLIEMYDGRILLAVPYEGRRDHLGKMVLNDVTKAFAMSPVELSTDDLIKAEEICANVASTTPIGGVEPMFKRMRGIAASEVATRVLTLAERQKFTAFRQGTAPPKTDKEKNKKK